jgi:hypothetical protein
LALVTLGDSVWVRKSQERKIAKVRVVIVSQEAHLQRHHSFVFWLVVDLIRESNPALMAMVKQVEL